MAASSPGGRGVDSRGDSLPLQEPERMWVWVTRCAAWRDTPGLLPRTFRLGLCRSTVWEAVKRRRREARPSWAPYCTDSGAGDDIGGVPVMGGAEDGGSAHESKQFGAGPAEWIRWLLVGAGSTDSGPKCPWEGRHEGLGSYMTASSCPARSRSHLRPFGGASGAGFDVLPVYRDLRQLQKYKSGSF